MQRALFSFCNDPFGIRALAGVKAYGTNQPFVGAWMDDQGELLIGRTENALTVCGVCRDTGELLAFLNVISGSSLLVPKGLLPESIPGWTLHRTGVVLADPGICSAQAEAEDGSPRDLAALLTECTSPWIEVGDRDALYTDLSHRIRHRCIHARMIRQEGVPAACALTMGESHCGAVIGGVACCPRFRGHGLGGRALQDLCAALQRQGKRIFLFTGDELTAYYQSYGFSLYDQWYMYDRQEDEQMG